MNPVYRGMAPVENRPSVRVSVSWLPWAERDRIERNFTDSRSIVGPRSNHVRQRDNRLIFLAVLFVNRRWGLGWPGMLRGQARERP